jgi:succinate dehydrogenase/fumarate reductase cytochrome b subunit
MLQECPELVWSFWQLVGLLLTLPFALFWFTRSLKKSDFRETVENDKIPIRVVLVFAILLLPLLMGETLAVVVCLLTYPDASEPILSRGFRYYLVALVILFLMLSLIHVSNRRKKKEQEAIRINGEGLE